MADEKYRIEGDTLIVNDGVTNIEGKDFHVFYDEDKHEDWLDYSSLKEELENIKKVIVPDSVTDIGYGAFCDLQNLEDVSLPNGIEYISSYAFWNCKNLKSITIPDGVTEIGVSAFLDCENLTSVTLPNSVEKIFDYAFIDCKNLTNITIPTTEFFSHIDSTAFDGCENLTITCHKGSNVEKFAKKHNIPVEYIDEKKYHIEGDTLVINDDVTFIEGEDFHIYDVDENECSDYSSLKEEFKDIKKIIVPDSVTHIGEDAFCDLQNLEDISLPNGITHISSYAFWNCKNLKSITIPDSVTNIYEDAFRHCESLTSIVIPNGVKIIDASAFENCKKLKSITIPDSVTIICEDAFLGCESLKNITIPNSVTGIGRRAFGECKNLTISCSKGSYAEKYAKENNIPYSYIEQDKKNENKQQTVIKKTEKTPAKPIKNGDIVQLTNFDNLYGMVSGMNEDRIFVLDCNGDERHIERSKESVLKPIKSSPAIKKAFCEMLDQIEMRQQIRDDIYNLEEQESEYDSKIADNTTLLCSLLSEKGKDNRDIER